MFKIEVIDNKAVRPSAIENVENFSVDNCRFMSLIFKSKVCERLRLKNVSIIERYVYFEPEPYENLCILSECGILTN